MARPRVNVVLRRLWGWSNVVRKTAGIESVRGYTPPYMRSRRSTSTRGYNRLLPPLVAALAGVAGCDTEPAELNSGTEGSSTSAGQGSTSGGSVSSSTTAEPTGSTTDESSTGEPPENCGDGVVEPPEQCDMGDANGPGQTCKSNCQTNICGDGDQGPAEACDDGNLLDGDQCSATCRLESCGNGSVDEGEECDDGANGLPDDGCTDDCRTPRCGDGFVQPNEGEACDDMNADNTDDCVAGCASASCGDGFTWADNEACDDGNDVDTDACLTGCIAATCGDGQVRTNFEECDDGGDVPGDGCDEQCEVEDGWSCDDGGCTSTCGDGITVGNECCDDGNTEDGDNCPGNCQLTQRQVFVTTEVYDGNDFFGVSGADSVCQARASDAGLDGFFRAWISDAKNPVAMRFASTPGCEVPYRLVDGTQIASDWDDLTDGSLAAPINVDEAGGAGTNTSSVWTGTSIDGTAAPDTCNGWQTSSSSVQGERGSWSSFNFGWTASFDANCNQDAHLYCFEQ